MLENIVPILHNVYSNQKVIEAARLVYGLGYKTFVITKASGTAADRKSTRLNSSHLV